MTDSATHLIHEAMDHSDDGDYEGAARLLTQAIGLGPTNPQAYHERAMALLNLNRERDALEDFDRALALDPVFPGSRSWRARTLAGLGEHRLAAEDWLRELRDCPNGPPGMGVCPQTWADCAEEFVKAGDAVTAVGLLEEYLAGHASRVTAYARFETAPIRLLARLLANAGNESRAADLRRLARASQHKVPADG